jgi:hypothetical protein
MDKEENLVDQLYATRFGSLESYEKGSVEIIADDPKNYAFSNIYEVASTSGPYEKVVVGMNREYVLEAIRTEGISGWRTAAHDEFALVMDGAVEIHFVKIDDPRSHTAQDDQGSVAIDGDPPGAPMGFVRAGKGHMVLLPADCAYQFTAESPGVVLLQTIKGPDSVERWADICLTTA